MLLAYVTSFDNESNTPNQHLLIQSQQKKH